MDSTLLGKLWTALGSGSTRMSCIPPGNNLILRLPGMLAEGYLYSVGECWDLLGIPNFLRADSGLTLLGESVADLLGILCLFGADGRSTLLGESIVDSFIVASLGWGELSLLSYFAGSESTLAIFFSWIYLCTRWIKKLYSLDILICPCFWYYQYSFLFRI